MLLVKGKSDYESFPKNKWNIAEPPLDADRSVPCLLEVSHRSFSFHIRFTGKVLYLMLHWISLWSLVSPLIAMDADWAVAKAFTTASSTTTLANAQSTFCPLRNSGSHISYQSLKCIFF